MSDPKRIILLESEIHKSLKVLDKLYNFYQDYRHSNSNPAAGSIEQAIVISDLICSYYTACETIFLRISQFFENTLNREKWHQDLLQKMALQIDGLRAAVISEASYNILTELLKFRHFKRYYFELEFDWDKLEFIQKKFTALHESLKQDFAGFMEFLHRLKMV